MKHQVTSLEQFFHSLPTQPVVEDYLHSVLAHVRQQVVPLCLEEILPILQLPEDIQGIVDVLPLLSGVLNPVELVTCDRLKDVKQDFLSPLLAHADWPRLQEMVHSGCYDEIKLREKINEITKHCEDPQFHYHRSTDHALRSLTGALQELFPDRTVEPSQVLQQVKDVLRSYFRLLAAWRIDAQDSHFRLLKVVLREALKNTSRNIALLEGLALDDVERGDEAVADVLQHIYGMHVPESLYISAQKYYEFLLTKPFIDVPFSPDRLSPQWIAHFKETKKDAYFFKDMVVWMLEEYYADYARCTGQTVPEEKRYTVVVTDTVNDIDVRDKSVSGPVILIPGGDTKAPRSLIDWVGLLRHEIERHALSSLNGSVGMMVGGGKMKIDNEVLYEGTAMDAEKTIKQELFGMPYGMSKPFYTFAARCALEGKSFVETFRELLVYILRVEKSPLEEAWKTTYRVFRGHRQTSVKTQGQGYGFLKDLAYFEGTLVNKQLSDIHEQIDALNDLSEEDKHLLKDHLPEDVRYLLYSCVPHPRGLSLLDYVDISPESLPFPDKNLTKEWVRRYCASLEE